MSHKLGHNFSSNSNVQDRLTVTLKKEKQWEGCCVLWVVAVPAEFLYELLLCLLVNLLQLWKQRGNTLPSSPSFITTVQPNILADIKKGMTYWVRPTLWQCLQQSLWEMLIRKGLQASPLSELSSPPTASASTVTVLGMWEGTLLAHTIWGSGLDLLPMNYAILFLNGNILYQVKL